MQTPDDGRPAFPLFSDASNLLNTGMSLRDFFAGQFLTTVTIVAKADAADIARNCYVMADAMLEARKR